MWPSFQVIINQNDNIVLIIIIIKNEFFQDTPGIPQTMNG